MADFVRFGSGVVDVLDACASCADRSDTADYLWAQQRAVQEKVISDRLSGNVPGKAADGGKGAQNAGAAASVGSKMAQLKALAGKK